MIVRPLGGLFFSEKINDWKKYNFPDPALTCITCIAYKIETLMIFLN